MNEWVIQYGSNLRASSDLGARKKREEALEHLLQPLFENNGSYEDPFILKLDPQGNYVWAVTFGNDDGEGQKSLDVDAQGNILTTGYFRDTIDLNPGTGPTDTAFYASLG